MTKAIHGSFTIDRVYDASPARVFKAFADPKSARDGEADPLLMQSVDCSPRPFGQHFVMRDERPVHVGKQ